MSLLTVLFVALGFAGPAEAHPAAGDSADAVQRVLYDRHFDDGCAPILALPDRDAVRERLVAATTQALPPWAPLRAVGCLTELAASDSAALHVIRELLADAQPPGFVLPIVARLDQLPEARAVELARLAMVRANAEPALRAAVPARLRGSAHASVRAAAGATAAGATLD